MKGLPESLIRDEIQPRHILTWLYHGLLHVTVLRFNSLLHMFLTANRLFSVMSLLRGFGTLEDLTTKDADMFLT